MVFRSIEWTLTAVVAAAASGCAVQGLPTVEPERDPASPSAAADPVQSPPNPFVQSAFEGVDLGDGHDHHGHHGHRTEPAQDPVTEPEHEHGGQP